MIVKGGADVVRRGKKLRSLGNGDFLGEIALVTGTPRTATVTTRADEGARDRRARVPDPPEEHAVDAVEGPRRAREPAPARNGVALQVRRRRLEAGAGTLRARGLWPSAPSLLFEP